MTTPTTSLGTPIIGSVVRFSIDADRSRSGIGIVLAIDNKRAQIVDVHPSQPSGATGVMAVALTVVDAADGRYRQSGFVCRLHTRWIPVGRCQVVGSAERRDVDCLLRAQAELLARSYYDFAHRPAPFVPGRSPVPVAGRCYGFEEIRAVIDAGLDFWLTIGRFNDAFEKRLAAYIGVAHAVTTNSGSSANLLAVSALTSPRLGDRCLRPGDEILTVAAGFPTTVNPILQNGLTPVFVDIDARTYNVLPERLEAAVGPRTRAVILAHTLGNPFAVDRVLAIARAHDLWLIEDCCDALGARFTPPPEAGTPEGIPRQLCGSFGHMSTFSFYPAHHITMGEGGAVATDDEQLKQVLLSFRDWGRDCRCPPGRDNVCGKRFDHRFGDLPEGYDHKYTYSHLGYNLKLTDLQAAVGLAQFDRLDAFHRIRRRNFDDLKSGLQALDLPMILPEATPGSDPAWFGFPLTLADEGISRRALLAHLHERKIATRLLFGGNLIRQPYLIDRCHRVAGDLGNTDRVMNGGFWLGIYPAITESAVVYTLSALKEFFDR